MGWEGWTILVGGVILVGGAVTFGLLYRSRGRKLAAALQEVERQKNETRKAEIIIAELRDKISLEGMTDDQARDEFDAGIADVMDELGGGAGPGPDGGEEG